LHRELVVLQRHKAREAFAALIIAAALTTGCRRLFSEDMQDGHVIKGLRIANPFAGL
jgi:predicted nucleic acid-binding protein